MPEGAKLLMLGTFPPGQHRWDMDFYYPNRTNDFWKIMGLIFLGDATALINSVTQHFDSDRIRRLMAEKHIALSDTAREVRRLRGNASDKHLDIVTPLPLFDLLHEMPYCHTVATTGEKAAEVIATITSTEIPRIGTKIHSPAHGLDLWRMPSTSRAYPLPLEQKAAHYETLFRETGII